MPEQEQWVPIPSAPKYEVSDCGRVRGSLGVRVPKRSKDGYLRIHLGNRPNRVTRTIHSLVAEAFLGPRPRGWCIAHKNNRRDDNRLCNLQYTTYSANFAHMKSAGTATCPLLQVGNGSRKRRILVKNRGRGNAGEAHGNAKHTESQAIACHQLASRGMLRKDIASEVGVAYDWVCAVLAGRQWRYLHPDHSLRR